MKNFCTFTVQSIPFKMKKLLIIIPIVLSLAACSQLSKKEKIKEPVSGTLYGDSVFSGDIKEVTILAADMKGIEKADMKIKGKVDEVCQKKGCWITMDIGDGNKMRVTFKDYKIFLPKDISGKEVVLDGFAYNEITSVEDQQHYAKDGGKTDAEVALITEPKKELAFEAKGVVIL